MRALSPFACFTQHRQHAHMTYANSHALNLYYFLTISFALLGRFEQGKEKLLQLAPHQGAKSVRSGALECIYF